jgi:predicted ATP-grasp superfamily ATP-dependent carboligase
MTEPRDVPGGARHYPRAIVIGGELGGLGVVRALAAAGVPTLILDTELRRATLSTRWGRKVAVADFGPSLLMTLRAIAAGPSAPAVILPTNEEGLLTLSRHRAELRDAFLFRLPDHGLLADMQRKEPFQSLAEQLGCPIPRAVTLRTAADLERVGTLEFPCVLKPGIRHPGYDTRFSKAYRVEHPEEARELAARMLPVLPDLALQEWIPGDNDAIHFCLQYRGADGRVLASFAGRKLRSHPPLVGITASCVGAPEAAAEIEALTEGFFGPAGVVGLCSMEFKRDARTGRFVMIEPTVGRTDWQEEAAVLNGVNIPLVAYCDLLGLPLPPARQHDRPVGWRNSAAHWHPDWLRRADAPAFAPEVPVRDAHWRLDDPLPGLMEWSGRGRRRLARLFGLRP